MATITLNDGLKQLIDFAKVNINNPSAVFPEDTGKNTTEIKKLCLKEAIDADYDSLIQDEIDIGIENDSDSSLSELTEKANSVIEDANCDINQAVCTFDNIKNHTESIKGVLDSHSSSADKDGIIVLDPAEINDIRQNADAIDSEIDETGIGDNHSLDDD